MIHVSCHVYDVKPIMTWAHGTCLKVQPNFTVTEVPFHTHFYIESNHALEERDQPRRYIIYLTSSNSWQGIVNHIWPQYRPSILTVKPKSSYYLIAKKIEYVFDNGVESTEKCWKKFIEDFDCSNKCRYATFVDDLPLCRNATEIECIMKHGEKNLVYEKCNKKKKGFTFEQEKLQEMQRFKESNYTEIDIEFWFKSKLVHEEVDVITLAELIGSVGGSIGMFFGISLVNVIWFGIDRCVERFVY